MRARRAFPFALVLGAFSATGFAPFDLWPLTFAAFAGLIHLLHQAATLRRALALGWWFGVGQFVVGLNWIATAFTYQAAMPGWLGWVAVVLLSLYLAVYPAAAAGLAWRYARADPLRLTLLFAAAWIVTEWLRATLFTGFAWNPLGVAWVAPGGARLAAWVGTYGLSGLAIVMAGGLLLLARRHWPIGLALVGLPPLLALVAALAQPAPPPGATRIRVVQPNVNQDEKWSDALLARNYARLARLTGAPTEAPRLILWPEVAVPEFLEEDPFARRRIGLLVGPNDRMLTGGVALTRDAEGFATSAANSVFAVDPAGRLTARYDKAHLVPYGEYLPARPILSLIGLSRLAPGDIDFRPGPGPRNLAVPGIGPVGVQVCYEIIFSGHVVDPRRRPRFLFNPSNDAWFGAWGPPQHLAQARLRAAEEGMPIVRATPTGISAVIDARGRVRARLPWHAAGTIDANLPGLAAPTFFARLGNLVPLMLALFLAAFALARRAR